MNNEDFIDYLNNGLLSKFDVTNIEFKLDTKKLISCMIGRDHNGDFVWYSYYDDYDDFFMGESFNKNGSFFENCENFLNYYDSVDYYLFLTEKDLKFLKIMSNCVRCSAIEELEFRLGVLGI
jgi:hypothetical protein